MMSFVRSVPSANRCPELLRPQLYANVLLTGGNCAMPNLRERIFRDLRASAPEHCEINVNLPDEPALHAWRGMEIQWWSRLPSVPYVGCGKFVVDAVRGLAGGRIEMWVLLPSLQMIHCSNDTPDRSGSVARVQSSGCLRFHETIPLSKSLLGPSKEQLFEYRRLNNFRELKGAVMTCL